jgi:hypothetical protein
VRRSVVALVLRLGFGAHADAVSVTKLGQATEKDIIRWGEGIFDAQTLDRLFTR